MTQRPVGSFSSWHCDVSAQDLVEALWAVQPFESPIDLPGFEGTFRAWNRQQLGVDCDEVYPDIYIGDAATVRNKQYLKEIRITHVLNCAEGWGAGQLDLSALYFRDAGIQYLGLPLEDMPSSNIEDYFECAAQYIDCALFNGGRVFVNCMMGVSRSAAIVIAFLMLRRGKGAVEAVSFVRRSRKVWPNAGFLRKLAGLHNALRRARCTPACPLYGPRPYASASAPMLQP